MGPCRATSLNICAARSFPSAAASQVRGIWQVAQQSPHVPAAPAARHQRWCLLLHTACLHVDQEPRVATPPAGLLTEVKRLLYLLQDPPIRLSSLSHTWDKALGPAAVDGVNRFDIHSEHSEHY